MKKLFLTIVFCISSINNIVTIEDLIKTSLYENIKEAVLQNNLSLAKSIIKHNNYILPKDKEILLHKKTKLIHLAAYFNIEKIFYNYNNIFKKTTNNLNSKNIFNKKTINNLSVLSLAIQNNSIDVIDIILSNELKIQNKKQISFILKLINNKNPYLLLSLDIDFNLLQKQDLSVKLQLLEIFKNINTNIALFFAINFLDSDIILKLLGSNILNININIQNELGMTALMYALENSSKKITEEIILKILELNPDINIQDTNGTTAFMIALRNKSGIITKNVLLKMLELNPDINIQDINGTTAFMIALRNKSKIVTKDILLKILSLNIDFEKNKNIIELAQEYQSQEISSVIFSKFMHR